VAAFLSHLASWQVKDICAYHLRTLIGDLQPATIWELVHVPDEDRWQVWESADVYLDRRAEEILMHFLEFCWHEGYGAPDPDEDDVYEDDEIFWGEAVGRSFEDWVLQRPRSTE
jgi:hypothetical protein